ncbi:hypothetical protein ENUP19_0083G0125 [Entamoeba nuttalli]|uniref:Transmembrane protein n=2 Tax=Entamoeba nuttalli TaxID=412467 RepID=K2GTP3_ENTNP|nr:hypothetical protein ENU1_207080 [Entamoeba nuttalli P19]EKE37152.1 hypothetical protein ENU1_207080 [Entamoeba nuttalli P19]|eukprot:XP_008860509.1 hypothetical protein ENU1_207080 [Entamoeba nuttalli P19]
MTDKAFEPSNGGDIEMSEDVKNKTEQPVENISDCSKIDKNKPMSLFSTNFVLRQRFGLGIALYFDFLYYVLVSDLVIGAGIVFVWSIQSEFASVTSNPLTLLYIEAYGSGPFNYYFFFVTNILFFIVCLGQGLYYYITRRNIIKREYEKEKMLMDIDEDFVQQINMPTERDKDGSMIQKGRSSWFIRKIWKIISYFIFMVFTLIFCTILVVIIKFKPDQESIQRFVDSQMQQINFPLFSFYDILVSVLLFVFYQILRIVAQLVSLIERHKKYIGYVKDRTIKYFIGKIFLVMSIYITNRIVKVDVGCPLAPAGSTFFTVVLTDLVLTNFFGILFPFIKAHFPIISRVIKKICKCIMPCWKDSFDENDIAPQFEIESEYFEIYFRQFNILIGSTTSPILMLIGALSFAIEYACDKIKLTKFCYQTKKTPGMMIRFNQWFLTFTFVLAFILWPYGGFWIVSGDLFGLLNKNYCDCSLFRSKNNFLLMQC